MVKILNYYISYYRQKILRIRLENIFMIKHKYIHNNKLQT